MDMITATQTPELAEHVHALVTQGRPAALPMPAGAVRTHPLWRQLRRVGTELWLDTGSLDEADRQWTGEFSALTTNNTLLNREVQQGTYDELVHQAAELLDGYRDMTDAQRMLEIGFILNARHGLRLVERFGAYVSVEEHTDLAGDVEGAVAYGRRYHAICPERFIVKIPFTPAGILATRRLALEGIPVNHTLGFSARQNYLVARLARPRFVNVFLGRLNAFVADNGLGDGSYVGERATLASQREVRWLRERTGIKTRQIGASFRGGGQVRDLAGMDVMTIPPKVAAEFLSTAARHKAITDHTKKDYRPPLAEGVDPHAVGLDTLWDVTHDFVACIDALEIHNLEAFSPDDVMAFFAKHGCGDLFVPWSSEQVAISEVEGKIPKLANWSQVLAGGQIGLDALMNLAGLNSFAADQKAMDDRIRHLLK
jgi:transaldolase